MRLMLFLMIGVSLLLADFSRDNTKQIVTDSITKLQWQDDSDARSVKKSWQGAISYCEDLSLGGYSDWRLPNKNELISIIDYSTYKPAMDGVFQNTISNG